ncbi:MAG: M23 family metallopeptidase [Clostridia bacterium]|nr:M23 family metallopeptidase [Clostridia bacterium]
MSRDYVGRRKKGGGKAVFISFCLLMFSATFLIAYLAKSNDNVNLKKQDNSITYKLDELYKNQEEYTENKPKKENEEDKNKAVTPDKPILGETHISNNSDNVTNNNVPPSQEREETPEIPDVETAAAPGKAVIPIENGKFKKAFGGKLEYSEVYGDWRSHTGVDISGKEGSKIRAIADGTIVEAYIDPVCGGVIKIDHGDFNSVYMGLFSESMELTGTVVKKGDTIGNLEGKITGESSETHLHFEIIEKGDFIDPMKFLG